MTEQSSKFNRSDEPVEARLKGRAEPVEARLTAKLNAVKSPSTVAVALRLLLRDAVFRAGSTLA